MLVAAARTNSPQSFQFRGPARPFSGMLFHPHRRQCQTFLNLTGQVEGFSVSRDGALVAGSTPGTYLRSATRPSCAQAKDRSSISNSAWITSSLWARRRLKLIAYHRHEGQPEPPSQVVTTLRRQPRHRKARCSPRCRRRRNHSAFGIYHLPVRGEISSAAVEGGGISSRSDLGARGAWMPEASWEAVPCPAKRPLDEGSRRCRSEPTAVRWPATCSSKPFSAGAEIFAIQPSWPLGPPRVPSGGPKGICRAGPGKPTRRSIAVRADRAGRWPAPNFFDFICLGRSDQGRENVTNGQHSCRSRAGSTNWRQGGAVGTRRQISTCGAFFEDNHRYCRNQIPIAGGRNRHRANLPSATRYGLNGKCDPACLTFVSAGKAPGSISRPSGSRRARCASGSWGSTREIIGQPADRSPT